MAIQMTVKLARLQDFQNGEQNTICKVTSATGFTLVYITINPLADIPFSVIPGVSKKVLYTKLINRYSKV